MMRLIIYNGDDNNDNDANYNKHANNVNNESRDSYLDHIISQVTSRFTCYISHVTCHRHRHLTSHRSMLVHITQHRAAQYCYTVSCVIMYHIPCSV